MNNLLQIDSLIYQVGDSGTNVTVSACLAAGSVLFINGPSGSGKTTLLRVICKLQPGTSGTVYLNGGPWNAYPVTKWRRMVHFIPQKPVIYSGTVWDNLAVPFTVAQMRKESTLDQAKAKKLLATILPKNNPLQQASTLSGGEAARLALIRGLLIEPTILLLDEPTASLDVKTQTLVLKVLAKWLKESPQRGIIMVSHGNDAEQLSGMDVPQTATALVNNQQAETILDCPS